MRLLSALVLALAGCVGPPAPDVELCRDVVSRLCEARGCEDVARELALDVEGAEACATTLAARAGCVDEGFRFGETVSVDRESFVECRKRLLDTSASGETLVVCSEASSFLACGESGALYRAVTQ